MSLKAHVAQENIEKSKFVVKLIKERCDEFSKVILGKSNYCYKISPLDGAC